MLNCFRSAARLARPGFFTHVAIAALLALASAAQAAPPTITYASPPPVFQAGGSVLLGNDAVIADPDSATLSKIDFLCCGGNTSLTLDADPATMGSIDLHWVSFWLGGASQYSLTPAAGPLPTLAQWQAAVRGLRVSFVGNLPFAEADIDVWVLPYDDGNSFNSSIHRSAHLLNTDQIGRAHV